MATAGPFLRDIVLERISVDHLCHLCYTYAQPFPPPGVLLCETGGRLRGLWVNDAVDEVALVEQAKSDPYAFGLLYERYVDKIYNYVYYRTGNHHDAEDLTAKEERCIISVKKDLIRRHPTWNSQRIKSSAIAICRAATRRDAKAGGEKQNDACIRAAKAALRRDNPKLSTKKINGLADRICKMHALQPKPIPGTPTT